MSERDRVVTGEKSLYTEEGQGEMRDIGPKEPEENKKTRVRVRERESE